MDLASFFCLKVTFELTVVLLNGSKAEILITEKGNVCTVFISCPVV